MKYKGSMLRRGILAGAMVLAGCGATVAVTAAPAGASNTEMTAVGSFTTFFMMHALFPELNDINPNAEVGSQTQSIAADSQTCSGGVLYSTRMQPPNGSGQGKAALAGEETGAADEAGCIDFSRSSSPPAPNAETLELSGGSESGDPTPSNLDYYAYALDGVAPLVGSDAPSSVHTAGSDTGASKGLTLAQLQAIYECVDTNWDQITVNGVTGANAPSRCSGHSRGLGRGPSTPMSSGSTPPSRCRPQSAPPPPSRSPDSGLHPERREHRGRHPLREHRR